MRVAALAVRCCVGVGCSCVCGSFAEFWIVVRCRCALTVLNMARAGSDGSLPGSCCRVDPGGFVICASCQKVGFFSAMILVAVVMFSWNCEMMSWWGLCMVGCCLV